MGLQSALVGVTGEDGKSIFDGKVVTGFSNAEEKVKGWEQVSRPACSKVVSTTKTFRTYPFSSKIASSLSAENTRRQTKIGVFVLTSVPSCSAPD